MSRRGRLPAVSAARNVGCTVSRRVAWASPVAGTTARRSAARGAKTREFLRLCEAAGVAHVYIGLESTNDAVLREMRKGVNRDRADVHGDAAHEDAAAARRRLVERYRGAVQAWHGIGASVECGYIVGFSADGRGVGTTAARDLLAIGADIGTFFFLAPLPGSEDYARALREGTLVLDDFNEYFQQPMVAHPTLSSDDLRAEVAAAVRVMWSWPNVARRIAGGVLGIGRRRVTTPWTYLKRQLGYKAMLSTGLHTYVEGGLWRRPAPAAARRVAVSDEEARHHYLGVAAADEPSALPAILRDATSMDSLPVLSDHAVGA